MTPKIPLYADVQKRQLASADGSSLSLPLLTLGDTVLFSLHALDRSSSNTVTVADLNVRTLRASIGTVMTAPDSGTFTLGFVNGSESGQLCPTSTVAALKTAIAALAECAPGGKYQILDAKPGSENGCWILQFNFAGEVPIAAITNKLSPVAFVRVRAFQDNDTWFHELRLINAPLVFTGTHERVLPEAPSIRRIRAGVGAPPEDSDGGQNEIQAIKVPEEFSGTYYVQFGFKRSTLLGTQATTDDIATALNGMYSDGATRFSVTNPEDNNAYVEFIGKLAKAPQELMTISVQSFSQGEIQFTLDLNNARLADTLRNQAQVALKFEVEAEVVDNADEISDATITGRIITLFSADVTIAREQIWEELNTVPDINWENPPQPKDYIPFTRDQIFQGLMNYIAVLGDGVNRSFVLNHNLGSDALAVSLRQNASGGRLLNLDEYTVTFPTANQAEITLPATADIPAQNSLAVLLISPFTVNAFKAHTQTIASIEGLEDRLQALENRVTTLESYIPTATIASSSSETSLNIGIPAKSEVLFYNPTKLDLTALPIRPPLLLPAISAAAATALPTSLTDATGMDTVWLSEARRLIPGFGRIPASYVEANGYIGNDGRILYPVNKDAANDNTYYPAAFERTLFEFQIDEYQLLPGKTLTVQFGLALQLLRASCEAQWVLVIEHGVPVDQATPATQGANLQSIAWANKPLLTQRLFVTPLQMIHSFGCNVYRSASGLTANKISYGASSVADSVPASPNFILRARLIQFDTRNNVHNAMGWLYYAVGDTTKTTGDATATIA